MMNTTTKLNSTLRVLNRKAHYTFEGWQVSQLATGGTRPSRPAKVSVGGPYYCDVATVDLGGTADQDNAAARLIAAAPQMLAALKCASAALTQPVTHPADIRLALLAIRKALEAVEG